MGTLFSTERSPLFSTVCLPHHRSYQATLSGPEWTRWHGSTELRPPSTPPSTLPLCSQPDSVCSSQLPPLSHSVRPPLHPEHLCSISFMYFLRVTALASSLLHNARLHDLQFQSRAAATLLCRPLIHSVRAPFSYFFSTLLLSSPLVLLRYFPSFFHTTPFTELLIKSTLL